MINPRRLGLAAGILWGFCMFLTTIVSIYTGYAQDFLMSMSSVYPGYTISWGGSFLGLIYGFFDSGIGFFLLAWLYNKLR
jgi:hypothetical protein